MKHVAEAGRRRAATGRHRARKRPRWGRIALVGAAGSVILTALLGGLGVLPNDAGSPASAIGDTAALGANGTDAVVADQGVDASNAKLKKQSKDGGTATLAITTTVDTTDESVPVDSGSGRRVVFSESRQRVWLVDDAGTVERTYLVSGSVYDNLEPGTYTVFSRSLDAVGIDDSGTMRYFVRFTHGDEGAAIGFHDIPVDEGVALQTLDELGTPQSHGCIRQATDDAVALWEFAPEGTTVVVTA